MCYDDTINFLYFDIYSKRISFFYNNKEKISSIFGLVLTLTYIFASIILFIYYFVLVIQRREMKVFESTKYSEQTPLLNVNASTIYLAFGIEDSVTAYRFIDETIYYPQILFIDKVKKDGTFYTAQKEELPYERCKEANFGKDYQKFFLEGELNTSYCLKQFNVTLGGGYKYDELSYIRIKILPCVNTTENNNHCKPREVIDRYISGAYFSLIIKDIGLNPSNITNPVLPTIQDLYTTIDKAIFRDFILYFGLTEIQSDFGFFNEQIYKQNYLKYRRQQQTFYFRDESEIEKGKEICVVQIRLDDYIDVQNRSYSKMPDLFSKIGGYMQLISTVFSILSILVNRIGPEIKILNGIFNFNIKSNKMRMKNNSLKEFKIIQILRKSKSNISSTRYNKNKKKFEDKNESSILPITIINNKNDDTIQAMDNKKSHKDKDDNPKILLENGKKRSNKNNQQLISQSKISVDEKEDNKKGSHDKCNDTISFNLFEYYCFRKFTSKKKEIQLFIKGSSLYRKRMDIINVFTLLLLTEKKLLNNHERREQLLFKKIDYPISPE